MRPGSKIGAVERHACYAELEKCGMRRVLKITYGDERMDVLGAFPENITGPGIFWEMIDVVVMAIRIVSIQCL